MPHLDVALSPAVNALERRTKILFCCAACAFFFIGLGVVPFLGPDEPRYAEVARGMFLRHEWITPTLAGRPWFDKPVLLYWLEIVSFKLLGVSEWTARLGPALCGVVTALTVYFLGRHIGAARRESSQNDAGFWSLFIFTTSLGAMTFSRGATTDIVLTMPVTLALACFAVTEFGPPDQPKKQLRAVAYMSVGVALLAKGLIGAILPLGIAACTFALLRRWPSHALRQTLWWGLPLCIGVASVWYAPVIARHGSSFIQEFIVEHHFSRYLTDRYHHHQPAYFFLLIAPLLALPWTILLLDALRRLVAHRRRPDEATAVSHQSLLLAWVAFPIAFFSASASKLPSYVLPALPAMSILTGIHVNRLVQPAARGTAIRMTGFALLFAAIAGPCFLVARRGLAPLPTTLTCLPLLMAGVILLTATPQIGRQRALLALGSGSLVSMTLFLWLLAPTVAREQSAEPLLAMASREGFGQEPVLELGFTNPSIEYYAGRRLVQCTDSGLRECANAAEVMNTITRLRKPVLVFLPPALLTALRSWKGLDLQPVGANRSFALVNAKVLLPAS